MFCTQIGLGVAQLWGNDFQFVSEIIWPGAGLGLGV